MMLLFVLLNVWVAQVVSIIGACQPRAGVCGELRHAGDYRLVDVDEVQFTAHTSQVPLPLQSR